MNLVVVKYLLLIGAILASTSVVAGPLNPQNLFTRPGNDTLTADTVYQFGSDVFYKEIDKPGNEYLQSGVQGYSRALVPTDEMQTKFQDHWGKGTEMFKSGYRGTTVSAVELAGVPQMTDKKEQAAVCARLRASRNQMVQALDDFAAAKASATPGSSQGFAVGMVMPRVEQMNSEAQDAEIACMQAVLADWDNNPAEFSRNLKLVDSHVREIRRIYPELGVVSDDFKTP